MTKLAFYKGTKEGVSGLYNRGVRGIEDGKYSHVEMIFSNGLSGSSSYMDGGVRFKPIDYSKHSNDWDIIDCPWIDEEFAKSYIAKRLGHPYDLKGNVHFIFGFIKNDSKKEFCSGLLAGAIGLQKPWQYAPNSLYEIVVLINNLHKGNRMLNLSNTPDDDNTDTGNGQLPDKPPTKPPVNP